MPVGAGGLDRIGHEQTFETTDPCSHLTCFWGSAAQCNTPLCNLWSTVQRRRPLYPNQGWKHSTVWSEAVFSCVQHSFGGLMVCLSLLENSGAVVSKGWGVLPRLSRVRPVTLAVRIRPDVIVDSRLDPERRQKTTVRTTSSRQIGPPKQSHDLQHEILVQPAATGSE